MWTSVTSGLAYRITWVEGGHLLKLVTHHMTKRRQGSQGRRPKSKETYVADLQHPTRITAR